MATEGFSGAGTGLATAAEGRGAGFTGLDGGLLGFATGRASFVSVVAAFAIRLGEGFVGFTGNFTVLAEGLEKRVAALDTDLAPLTTGLAFFVFLASGWAGLAGLDFAGVVFFITATIFLGAALTAAFFFGVAMLPSQLGWVVVHFIGQTNSETGISRYRRNAAYCVHSSKHPWI